MSRRTFIDFFFWAYTELTEVRVNLSACDDMAFHYMKSNFLEIESQID